MDTNLQKYMAFMKTVEYGSFTKAAELLNYSQSGISRMIHDLEKIWNVSLLERGRTGVKLTSEGLKLLPSVKKVCHEYMHLQEKVDELNDLQSGLIRIGAFSGVAAHWFTNMIKAFQMDYPNVDYELLIGDYTEIEEWISTGRVDGGFLRMPTCSAFETVFVEKDPLVVVLPETHPLVERGSFPLQALCENTFILMETSIKSEMLELFEKNNLSPRIRLATWDDNAIMSMVENGLGIGILPQLVLRRIPYRVVAKELEIPAYREIGLAVRDKKRISLAMKKFMAYADYR